jgi:hypothetical protein
MMAGPRRHDDTHGQAATEVVEVFGLRRPAPGAPAEVTRGASTASNRDGGTTHRRQLLRESPMTQRLRAQLPSSGSF